MPYTIHHLQWEGLFEAVLPPGKHYVVVWQGRTPVGHYWMERGGALAEHREAIGAALDEGLAALHAGAPAAPRRLSVVVCTRDRAADLKRCLEYLAASTDKDFELIVVDNASRDNDTEQVVRAFPGALYLREDRPGLDIARNTGAFAATGDIVAYTDDDVEVSAEWTGDLKRAFDDPLVMAVTGLVLPKSLDTEAQYRFERFWSFGKGYVPRTFDHAWFRAFHPYSAPVWDIGAGANMAFRRDIFYLAGGFDPRLDVGASGCSGDSEMWYRVLAEGWNCRYLPGLVVYHRHRTDLGALRRQLFFYMRGHVSALLVQYERYHDKGNLRRIYRGLPRYYAGRLARARAWLPGGARGSGGGGRAAGVWNEIRGCVSGWRFYGTVKDRPARPYPPNDLRLGEAVTGPETLVSVIIPCHNHGHFLRKAIQSVFHQTHRAWEIIVVDDGSTDDTRDICRGIPEVRYVRVERVGPSAARNIGVGFSGGQYLVFLDADDFLYSNALETNLYFFGYDRHLAYVSGGHDLVDGEGHYLHGPDPFDMTTDNYLALLRGNYIGMEATVMYRRALFPTFYFDPSMISCEDYDLNLRIARVYPVLGHHKKIAAYRIHGGNRSRDKGFMLRSALGVLNRQELRSEEEQQAYEEGVHNWKQYYHRP
jgi:glycosyltransferase involved in cell wall biosynthesis